MNWLLLWNIWFLNHLEFYIVSEEFVIFKKKFFYEIIL